MNPYGLHGIRVINASESSRVPGLIIRLDNPTTYLYVPETVRKLPTSTTKLLQQIMESQAYHLLLCASLPFHQLSYNHMHPIGWQHIIIPSREPTSEARESKTGIALAVMYAITTMPRAQLSQAIQCVGELLVRCLEPWRMCRKMNFAGICICCNERNS